MTVIFQKKGYVFEIVLLEKSGEIFEVNEDTVKIEENGLKTEFLHDIDLEKIIFETCIRLRLHGRFTHMLKHHKQLIIDEFQLKKIDKEKYREIRAVLNQQIYLQNHPLNYIPKDIILHTKKGNIKEFKKILGAISLLAKKHNYEWDEIIVPAAFDDKEFKQTPGYANCDPKLSKILQIFWTTYAPEGGIYRKNNLYNKNDKENCQQFEFVADLIRINSDMAKYMFVKARERLALKTYLKDTLSQYGKSDNGEIDKIFSDSENKANNNLNPTNRIQDSGNII